MSVRALVSTTRLTAATCRFHAGKRLGLCIYLKVQYGMSCLLWYDLPTIGQCVGQMRYVLGLGRLLHTWMSWDVWSWCTSKFVCSLSETTCNMSYRHVAQRFTRQNSHLEDVVISQCQPCDGVGGCGWPIHSICSIDESTSTQPQKRCIRNSNSTWSTVSQWLGRFYSKETG